MIKASGVVRTIRSGLRCGWVAVSVGCEVFVGKAKLSQGRPMRGTVLRARKEKKNSGSGTQRSEIIGWREWGVRYGSPTPSGPSVGLFGGQSLPFAGSRRSNRGSRPRKKSLVFQSINTDHTVHYIRTVTLRDPSLPSLK